MRKERVMCNVSIDEYDKNVLILQPYHLQGFKDDSIYEFRIPAIYDVNGTKIEPTKIKYITKPSIAYSSIKDIRTVLGDIDISDEIILRQIKDASRYAEVLLVKAHSQNNIEYTKEDLIALRGDYENIKDNYYYVWEFVTLKAAYESLTTLYIYMATKPDKIKEVLSDLSKELNYNLSALKDLLDNLKRRIDDIKDQFVTFADPTFTLRGKLCLPYNIDMGAPYHRLNGMNGYNRNFNGFGGRY